MGGGTPSKLSPGGVARLVELIRSRATIAPDAEVTLEANPEDVTDAAVAAWRASGVNRVSLGVQSFDPAVLQWMHRTHTTQQSRQAVERLRTAGLDNVSIDLIFAAPAALERSWERDIESAIALAVPHVSVYGLTV